MPKLGLVNALLYLGTMLIDASQGVFKFIAPNKAMGELQAGKLSNPMGNLALVGLDNVSIATGGSASANVGTETVNMMVEGGDVSVDIDTNGFHATNALGQGFTLPKEGNDLLFKKEPDMANDLALATKAYVDSVAGGGGAMGMLVMELDANLNIISPAETLVDDTEVLVARFPQGIIITALRFIVTEAYDTNPQRDVCMGHGGFYATLMSTQGGTNAVDLTAVGETVYRPWFDPEVDYSGIAPNLFVNNSADAGSQGGAFVVVEYFVKSATGLV